MSVFFFGPKKNTLSKWPFSALRTSLELRFHQVTCLDRYFRFCCQETSLCDLNPPPQIRSIYTHSWRTNVSITDFQINFQIFLLYTGNMGRGSSKITNIEPRFHWKVIPTIISFKQVEKSPLELADNLLEEIFRFRG